MAELLLMSLLFASAALLHGVAGIGFPLVLTAALGLFLPMRETVILSSIPILLVNLISMSGGAALSDILRRYGLLALCSTLGSAIGVKLLLIIPSAWLQLALALLICLYLLLSRRSLQLQLPAHPALSAGFGLAAGIVGGATNAMSSLLMIYLFARSRDKAEIAQAANLCFALAKVVQIALLWEALWQMPDLAARLALPTGAAIAALFAGIRLRRRIAFATFRRLSLLVLAVLALILLGKSLHQLLPAMG